ncbi:non-homologous end-joining DNA ligase [Streptacidiphilus jiangxiensis]|uniref:Bifunctional non-homologous end joining protein LigD n=1 Tax=Streptacidiphilus jiangxiensis TaxID=235985 RepID=A0A1H7W085_STRJI|nr:non-homologous end-joining DNA ligase [Streptacidiphilus jiangxiensis]SEM14485.1 bifunctional non-homologous end joining protein LigD [Streptacidiphilus jiangxiensis]
MPGTKVPVQVGGRSLLLSHLDKLLWPAWSKAEMLDYYARVADAMVPHLRDRPASFLRGPEGMTGPLFVAKNPPPRTPEWVRIEVIEAKEGPRPHLVLDDAPSLIAAANLYCLEVHVPQWSLSHGRDGHDRLVVDLDPGEGTTVVECCAAALLVREALAEDGLPCWPVTSGNKGLHLYAPLRPSPAAATVDYARRVAERLAAAHPTLLVARMTKALRTGRVFLDWSQNSSSKTTSAPYTLRATRTPVPGVSAPLTWSEVESCATPADLALTPTDVAARVAELGDLAADLCDPRQAAELPS